MKKNIFKVVLFAVLAAPAFTSCELDQYPTSSIPNEESWVTFSDVTNFDIGLHSMLRSISCVGWYDTDLQADYYQPGLGYGNNGGTTYNWSFDSRQMEGLWATMYGAIMQANNFLDNCDMVELKAEDYEKAADYEADAKAFSQYKADAYFVRAFAYMNMAVRYCKDYEPETAATDLGLPLVTTVDINAKPARSSLAETFKLIKDDLAKAREFVQNENPTDQEFVSKQMVDFLEARVDLYMHNYDEAVTLAQGLIDDQNFALVDNADALLAQLTEDSGSEFVFVAQASNTEGAVNYSTYFAWNKSESAYSPYFILAKDVIDAYDRADIRKAVFFTLPGDEETVKQTTEKNANVYLLNKFPKGNLTLNTSSDDPDHTYKHAKRPFRIAEMVLVAAEASYRAGDELEAQRYLSMLTTARGLGGVQELGDALFERIKMEWYREFIGEGQRLDGLKRWHDGFTRSGQMQADNLIMKADPANNIELSVTPDNPRFVWEIPYNDLLSNPNLEKNWNF